MNKPEIISSNGARTRALAALNSNNSSTIKKAASTEQSIQNDYEDYELLYTYRTQGSPRLYVFGNQENYIITPSSENNLNTILCEGEGKFDPENISPDFLQWIEGLGREIEWYQTKGYQLVEREEQIREDNTSENTAQSNQDNSFEESETSVTLENISPLIPAMWSQFNPYSDDLQYIRNLAPAKYTKSIVTGCTQTALAMVVYYWGVIGAQTEQNGRTVHRMYRVGCPSLPGYTMDTYRIAVPGIEEGIELFDYDNFVPIYKKYSDGTYSYNSQQAHAVSVLMHYLAIADQADFRNGATGAAPADAANTIKNYLKLSTKADYVSLTKDDLTNPLKSRVYNDLYNGRPVIMTGAETASKKNYHAFVCDGFRIKNVSGQPQYQYHFRWGWGTHERDVDNYQENYAWCPLTAIVAKQGGTVYHYNYHRNAIIGVDPRSCPLWGDINLDGKINMMDVTQLIHVLISHNRFAKITTITNSQGNDTEGIQIKDVSTTTLFFPFYYYYNSSSVTKNQGVYWSSNSVGNYAYVLLVSKKETKEFMVSTHPKTKKALVRFVYKGDTPEEDGAIPMGYVRGTSEGEIKRGKKIYWAPANAGAETPADCGNFYTWEEAVALSESSDKWRLPTDQELTELTSKTSFIPVSVWYDTNQDGEVNMLDVQAIIDKILGK